MQNFIYLALFSPLFGSLFSSIFSHRQKNIATGLVTSALLGVSFISSLVLFFHVKNVEALHINLLEWIKAGSLSIPFGVSIDEVSVTMMVVVTLVSTAVHVYSMGYMEHDKGFNRYFAYLSAFVFSMLILVMSDNFAGLFIGWEGVGLCSWMLIGFWYHKKSASWAANEAFIMNRVADLGMLMGLFFIYWSVGSLQYSVVFSSVPNLQNSLLLCIGAFLFVGAMGKSAQFPFHTWLADAMEGPTPVSALIHAATMVTAGVYLVIRCFAIFSVIPQVSFFIACLGAFVAVFAASMALVNNDLKRIIAYSTLSQLGYMFVAAGLGAYWIALFHLATHAFFKSLLFLGAGNVMHAMKDELDIRKMGGLYAAMKYTAILMILASIALSGIYPFAGFFSKDKILEVAFNEGQYLLWFMLLAGAFMTAFYSFRLVLVVFYGEKRYEKFGIHPHEAHNFVLYAMLPLGVLSIVAGFLEHFFEIFSTNLLPKYEAHLSHMTEYLLIGGTSFVALSGIFYAYFMYAKRGGFSENLQHLAIYKILINQYFVPKFYEKVFIIPYKNISALFWQIDQKIVDASVDMVATLLNSFSKDANEIFQKGNLSIMLRFMIVGVVILLLMAFVFNLTLQGGIK